MALNCGIIGISGSGKTTIFNCISNNRAQTGSFSGKTNLGLIQVPDPRLYELEKIEPTEKIIQATVNIVDIPGLVKGGGENSNNKFLADIRGCDALIHVVRCFEDPTVPHPDGNVNPVRDIENIEIELEARDLESVQKKMVKVEKQGKAGDKDAKACFDTLQKIQVHLEEFKPVRELELSEAEKKWITDIQLLSAKPVLYVCNVDENSAILGNKFSEQVAAFLGNTDNCLIIAGKIEAEIAELEDENDRKAFLDELGLTEPGVHKLVRSAYAFLKLQTFFTVGPKEIRAWTVKMGSLAPVAAGVIHSDLEKGFIRAEVMKYDDFISLKGEQHCKDKGKFFVEGKNYEVKDGDILHIRFNV
ncbi:MAG: redox-regulated ATPase YchF [Bacteroidetes bacterium HGW-Bacteroidetes-21]|jgi:hypothetical protein|nr:MAG: redox-regulated ATPase YchF [Bacteroidetes bacterium HGW-Bacteroidetes-21]